MGKVVFNSFFNQTIKKGTTATPTITEVSTTASSITFNLTNNDTATANVYYDLDPIVALTGDEVMLAADITSDDITIGGLDLDTEYTVYAVASAVQKQTSQQAELAITTDFTLPQYELLYEETVVAAKTQIDVTGLNIGKDDGLRLIYTFVGNTTANTTAFLFVNGNNTITNYHTQELTGFHSSFQALRYNSSILSFHNNARNNQGFADIKISNNDRVVIQNQYISFVGAEASGIQQRNFSIVGTSFTLTSITSIRIGSDIANEIGIGSKIALYKVTEAA